jgi:hypothetical protein
VRQADASASRRVGGPLDAYDAANEGRGHAVGTQSDEPDDGKADAA